jgi:subtilisin family serine protease
MAALAFGPLPANAGPALAPDIPVGCGLAVGSVERAALAGVAPGSLGDVAAAVRRLGGTVAGRIDRIGAIEVALPAGTPAALTALRAVPGVRWAEREHLVRASRSVNDPFQKHQWGLKAVGAFGAWDRETGNRNPVTVAVLDTGIDLAHPDLVARVTDGTNELGGTTSLDDNGHGTHVGGIIAASTNNRVGVAGMSWGARLLAVKVLNDKGEGTDCSVVNGYLDAVDAGAKVINMSLGADAACPIAYGLAVRYGQDKNVVPVAASGNSGDDGNPTESPASCEGVVAVGALDDHGKVATFSGHKPYVALSAPGVYVLSTYIDTKTESHVYGIASGTSMASPFVAGLAALLLSAHPDWTAQQVRDRMTSTARDLGPKGKDEFYGAGRIDAAKALR